MLLNITGLFQRISGSPRDFPLTIRIFHSVLVICMAALIYNIPLNIVVGLPIVALASAISCLLAFTLYYLSRYGGKTTIARLIFCITGTALFVINYFLNSGIDGPTGFFFVLIMVIIVAVAPVNEYWYWVTSNIILLMGLHIIQYVHPEWVPYTYATKGERYVDISSAYITVVLMVLACFYIIRKRYESERLEAEQNAAKLERLDAEKNKLFSIISHDLRSPLAHIQNYLEMLVEYDLTDQERSSIKTQLLHSTRGTLDMVNNVLYWSKNQLEGAKASKQMLDVAVLLQPQVELFRSIAVGKQIELESIFMPDVSIWGNADMVQLIVRNLLNNAVKFTAPGGNVRISATSSAGVCLLVVKDSGDGNPVNLSEESFQFSTTTSRGTANETGVGLGLALCREYTAQLGGRIWFSNDQVSGVTFFIELPSAKSALIQKTVE